MARTKQIIKVSENTNNSLENFKQAFIDSALTDQQKKFVLGELSSAGLASSAIIEINKKLKTVNERLKQSKDAQLAMQLKHKRKELEQLSKNKAAKVLGVFQTLALESSETKLEDVVAGLLG